MVGEGKARKEPERRAPRMAWGTDSFLFWFRITFSLFGGHYAVNTSFAVYFAQLALSKVFQLGKVSRVRHPFKKLLLRGILINVIHEVEMLQRCLRLSYLLKMSTKECVRKLFVVV